jgi:hypothetical protein
MDDSKPLPQRGPKPASDLKLSAILFLLFLVVVSDAFVASVISPIGESAAVGRTPTAWGSVLQGCMLVGMFMGAKQMVTARVL